MGGKCKPAARGRAGFAVLCAGASVLGGGTARGECGAGDIARFAASDEAAAAVDGVIAALGFTFQARALPELSAGDLGTFGTVIVLLGAEAPDRAGMESLAAARDAGTRLVLLGGTPDPLSAADLGELLLGNDPSRAGWAVAPSPQGAVADAGHALARGLASSFDFADPEAGTGSLWVDDPGAEVVATAGDGRPALAWKPGGGGLAFAGFAPDPAHLLDPGDLSFWRDVLWNVLHQWPGCCSVDRSGDALILQDAEPWGYDALESLMGDEGIPYRMAGSADVAGLDLAEWRMVAVASVQGSAFADAVNARTSEWEAWIEGGGVLLLGLGSQSGDTLIAPPFGGVNTRDPEYYVDVVDASHPLVAGLPEDLVGYYASHNRVSGPPEGAEVVAEQTYSPYEPVLYALRRGAGLLVATGLVWEYGWGVGQDAGDVLVNAVPYGWAATGCGCTPGVEVCDGVDNDCDGAVDEDQDGDGAAVCGGDCDDEEAAVGPGLPEACDGLDNDCDGVVDNDGDEDEDGASVCQGDCDDRDPSMGPEVPEACDGIDQDCDGDVDEDFDLDLDGVATCEGDCDDGDGTTHAGAPERCDGLDNDCDGRLADYEVDGDGDGFLECGDCDDGDAEVHPAAVDDACDGVDQDCGGDPHLEVDDDGDGFRECDGDCDDGAATVWPDAPESCDGRDNDCDPSTDEEADADGDGLTLCGGDCDDRDPGVAPGREEVCDGRDQDCDGAVDDGIDQDRDGWYGCDAEDCDDYNPYVHPGAPEVPYDGVDQDCDSADDTDLDGDGYDGGPGGPDCDDLRAAVNPGAQEECGDGRDDDCDRLADAADPDCSVAVESPQAGCAAAGRAPAGSGGGLVALALAWAVRGRRRGGHSWERRSLSSTADFRCSQRTGSSSRARSRTGSSPERRAAARVRCTASTWSSTMRSM